MISDGLRLGIAFALLVGSQGISKGYCRGEECAQAFQRTKDYESLQPSPTERYCQVLQTYLHCMNETFRFCHGDLRYHSSELVMRRHWSDFHCHRFQLPKNSTNRCHFLPATSHRTTKLCALFGDPHLLRFDRVFETCTEEGARPLVDNRYFLVQVTNSNVRGEALTTAVSKVTILIRKHNCTSTLRYEAASDEQSLPISFVDGTTAQKVDGDRNSVEVLWQEPNYVEIALHHVHASIHVRRQGPYLAVAIRAPKNVLETGTTESNELCWSGCRKASRISLPNALSDPNLFSSCYARKLHVPLKLAVDRCNDVGVTDEFFDACVFDLMLTGDDYLVSLASSTQSDVRRMSHHPFAGRISLPEAPNGPTFSGCLASSYSRQKTDVFISLIAAVISFFLM
ncbi:unnamed protein product [Caenorhabditis auriculariae]|uniref:Uncharacterized protein n=1 Tax=Caenorhabditis auriculariae TaxID=2777116 RepID=A0A8S1H0H7_9PELO|nr:unnamed protein product [Caenorhabditis auriculariae]